MYTKVIILSSNAKKCPAGSRTFHFQFSLSKTILELPPDHLIDDAGVALDDLYDLGRDVFSKASLVKRYAQI